MRNTISIERIKETFTYKDLESKKDQLKLSFLKQKSTRENITHAFLVWRNTGNIPNTVTGISLAVVKDLIAMSEPQVTIDKKLDSIKEVRFASDKIEKVNETISNLDANWLMTCENVEYLKQD